MIGTESYRKQVKMSEIKKPKRHSPLSHGQSKHVSSSIRERVLKAAFTLFREHGFSSTSMLDIVTRARVSKRDLYALFNNKHAVLAACISERAQRMRRPLDATTPVPQTPDALASDRDRAALIVTVAPAVVSCCKKLKIDRDEFQTI